MNRNITHQTTTLCHERGNHLGSTQHSRQRNNLYSWLEHPCFWTPPQGCADPSQNISAYITGVEEVSAEDDKKWTRGVFPLWFLSVSRSSLWTGMKRIQQGCNKIIWGVFGWQSLIYWKNDDYKIIPLMLILLSAASTRTEFLYHLP